MQEAGQEVLDGLSANAAASTALLIAHAATPHGGGGTPFSIPGLPDQDTALADDDLVAIWDESDGQTEKVTLGVVRTFAQAGLAGGLQLSDADPANVGEPAAPGDEPTTSRSNHGHALPITVPWRTILSSTSTSSTSRT